MAQQIRAVVLIMLLFFQIYDSSSQQEKAPLNEQAINSLTDLYLTSSNEYLIMTAIVGNSGTLPGLKAFFQKQSDEKRETAIKLMEYQNMRGGTVILDKIKSTVPMDRGSFPSNVPFDVETNIDNILHAIYEDVWHGKDYDTARYVSGLMEKQIPILSKTRKIMNYLESETGTDMLCPVLMEKLMC